MDMIEEAKTAYLTANLKAARAAWEAACMLPNVLSLCAATTHLLRNAMRRETIAHLAMMEAQARLNAQKSFNTGNESMADVFMTDVEHIEACIANETAEADRLNSN